MLATAVDSSEWFFMEKDSKFVPACHTLHHIHEQLVVIDGHICFFKIRRAFKLCRCNFIVSCFYRNAEAETFGFKIEHEGIHSLRDASEIMIFQLLTFSRGVTK